MKDIERLTLHEVADHLGVHYMTAYRYVRLGMLPAEREGRSWVVRRADVESFADDRKAPPERGSTRWGTRFVNRLLAGDEPGAWGVVEAALASGMTPREAYREMLIPALTSIGERWQRGELDVATEHAATAVATRVVGRLGPRMKSRGVRRGTVVLGATQTELHTLPMALAADLFRSARFEVLELGANLPADSFALGVSSADDVVAVGIGVTMPGQDKAVAETVAAIRDVTDVPVIVGGGGIDGRAAAAAGADAYARTAEDAIRLVESYLVD